MLTIHEMLRLEMGKKLRLAAGSRGLGNHVGNVGILEYETEEEIPVNFARHDFVVTTLFFAKDDPQLAESRLRQLMELGVSGIAVKEVFYRELDQGLITLAERYGIPIFFYEKETFTEDLIGNIKEALKTRSEWRRMEAVAQSLLYQEPNKEALAAAIREINERFRKWIVAVYCVPCKDIKSCCFTQVLDTIMEKRHLTFMSGADTFMKYKNGILLLHSFDQPAPTTLRKQCEQILSYVGISELDFHVGISGVKDRDQEFHCGLQEALWAAKISRMTAQSPIYFPNAGIYGFLLPMAENPVIRYRCQHIVAQLHQYDQENNYNLYETACEYIRLGGEIRKTAEAMYQHPNTIRYRLQKIRELLDTSQIPQDSFYEELYITIEMDKIPLD